MDDLSKSIRVGTVDFFGILIPGALLIFLWTAGFFLPLLGLVMDISGARLDWAGIVADNTALILTALTVFSYVLGYILRLSSPDELDRRSARQVIRREKEAGTDIVADCWPFDPDLKSDKYPYFRFRNYLIQRGHAHLAGELVTWGADEDFLAGKTWPDKGRGGRAIKVTKRSKSAINRMKMNIRLRCPELTALLESKEGHIRLMAGAWAAFGVAGWPMAIALVIVFALGVLPAWLHIAPPLPLANHDYLVYVYVDAVLLLVSAFCSARITKLFHYRRVSELFHIVEAAYIAEQADDADRKGRAK